MSVSKPFSFFFQNGKPLFFCSFFFSSLFSHEASIFLFSKRLCAVSATYYTLCASATYYSIFSTSITTASRQQLARRDVRLNSARQCWRSRGTPTVAAFPVSYGNVLWLAPQQSSDLVPGMRRLSLSLSLKMLGRSVVVIVEVQQPSM